MTDGGSARALRWRRFLSLPTTFTEVL